MIVEELIGYLEKIDPDLEIQLWEYNHQPTTLGKLKTPVISLVTKTSTKLLPKVEVTIKRTVELS